jgi:cytochrome c553
MKHFSLKLATFALVGTISFTLEASAQDHAIAAVHKGCEPASGAFGEPLDPKSYLQRNCAYCHGPSMQGFAVAPRIAGQHSRYIKVQLQRLRNETRNNPFSINYMSHVAAGVQPEAECDLSLYLETLHPDAARDGNEALVAQGEEIFRQGVAKDNIPACAFCHGPKAQGTGIFPRLGGQSYHYLQRRLQQWVEGYSKVAEHMPGIAAKLSPEQIEAIASYLSFVQYRGEKDE